MKMRLRTIFTALTVMLLILVSVLIVGVAHAAAPTGTRVLRTITNTATTTVTEHQYYGSDPRQRLDAYIHDAAVSGGRAWVVVYHGGSWENATKDTGSAVNLAKRWYDEGFNVFNAEYEPTHNVDGSLYISATTGKPVTAGAMRVDTQLAINYIKANAASFNIDPERGASYGFSAGGHLAALNGAYYNSVKVVVSVSGVLKPDYLKVMGEQGYYGDQEATKDMFMLADYATILVGCPHRDWTSCGASWNAFKPDNWLKPGRPAFYVIQGADDTVVPYATLGGFTYWLRYHGIDYKSNMAAGFGHTDAMIAAGTPLWEDVVAYVKAKTA